MKKLFTLVTIAMCCLAASAATKYEINVAGTEVTSDNCSYIGPSSNNDIESGYAVYSPSTNTLTCYNIYISRLVSGSYGIHNRKCDDLTIVFKNTCYVFSLRAPALKLERSTTIKVDDQTKLNLQAGDITGSDGSANTIEMGSHDYFFTGGKGTISIRNFSPQAKDCFKGNGNSNTCVVFSGGVVTIKSDKGYAFNSTKAYFRNGSDARIQPNGSKQSFYNSMVSAYEGAAILEPFGAYSDLNNTVYNSSGTAITNQDIYISSNFVAIFKKNWFDDENFCQALLNIIPKGYITSSDVPNITSLDVSNKNISSIVGIQWFSDLKTLDCSKNNITSFNISMLSKLQTFNCSYNKVSTIYSTFPSSLTNINLFSNNLTSFPTLPSGIQNFDCGQNKFTSLDIRGYSSLKYLQCNNNTLMTKLICSSNALVFLDARYCGAMTQLDCSQNNMSNELLLNGCSGLTYLDCSNNNLSTINFADCKNLKVLYCQNNALTALTNLSGCTALQELNCSYNLFTTLEITGKSNFAYFNCNNNTNLRTLKCNNNALIMLSAMNCTYLESIECQSNILTSLRVKGCYYLSSVNCSVNQLKESAMSTFVDDLRTMPNDGQGILKVLYPSNSYEGNVFTNSHVVTARNKRWYPKKYVNSAWVDIVIKGDVNGDGKINVTDVTALVNMILGVIPKNLELGDINGDGKLNVTDVTALVNIILGLG